MRFDAYPEPYIGDIDKARVVFLVLNPGFDEQDIHTNPKNPHWVSEIRKNLRHEAAMPFFYLSDKLSETGGYKWWRTYLKPLHDAGVSWDQLGQFCMCVELFPYHSVQYRHNKQYLPSQQYSFWLVRKAMRLNKTIVIMRARSKWLDAVPELTQYEYLELRNPQRVYVSPRNVDKKNNVGLFAEIVHTLLR